MVAAVIMGPLQLSKEGKINKYILVFVDLFTKWVEIISIKEFNGKTKESYRLGELRGFFMRTTVQNS